MMRERQTICGTRGRLGETVRCFTNDCSGATAIEYAILTFIAVAVLVAVNQLGGTVGGMYDRVLAAFKG